jgi:phosphoglucan,water dikinase
MIHLGNQTACWAASPREPFDYAVANGFDAFEWFPDKKPAGGWDEDDLNETERRKIRETARARGMRLSVHARWQANPLQPESQALFAKDIQLADDLGAALLNIHLYAERGIFAYVEAIRPLITRLAEAGLQLAIENTPEHSPEDFNELFAHLRRLEPQAAEHVGMCFDLGHANLCAATRNNYLQFLDRLELRVPIIHLHLHENYGDADTHLPLFTGPSARDPSGIRGLVERLRKRNFAGSVIFEQWPHPPSLLNRARNQLLQLLDATADLAAPGPGRAAPAPIALDPFAWLIVEGDRRSKSWREKLDFIRELLVGETAPFTTEQLVDIAIYLRFLGTGEIVCAENGRHFRPAHHARIALQIRERLALFANPGLAFIIRKIYPWLPSSSGEFQRAEPLTRIRDIAHRNDIPAELKREIKHSLQNKLHRCAGPEDLATATALLERITAPGAGYAPAFVEQFRIFHEELREFFNARSLDERLQALLPAVNDKDAHLIRQFLREKREITLAGQLATFRSLTELRRCLLTEAEQVPELARQDFLLADIALEDFAFALLSELANAFEANAAGATCPKLLEVLLQTLANLAMSQIEPDECGAISAEMRAWFRGFEPADREELLRLKATANRARRLAENYSDRIMAWFPPRALALGRALGVPEPAIQVFGDAEIRSHLVFQLSKLVSHLLRRLRQKLAQPAWDVVVSGNSVGRLKLVEALDGKYPEPVLVLLQSAEGDEEIPAGVTGIVLAHDLPHLSHLGVRARQAGVVLVVCEEPARIEELKQLTGSLVTLSAAADKVEWGRAEAVPAARVRHHESPPPPKVQLLPDVAWLPLEQAHAECAGNKANGVRRLSELARHGEAGFKVPSAVVVPFSAMEQALRAQPKIEMEYRRILNRLPALSEGLPAAAKRLRELIQQLVVPHEITAGVCRSFNRHTPLMVRSSANDEDLPAFAAAGLYESVANVPPAEVALAVRDVWASLWTRRAILSRQQAGVPQSQVHMAVLIQQLLTPDFSFILHTVNPVNRNPREAYVELVVGLGETLASATAKGNPWRLVCEKNSGSVAALAFANYSDALWPIPTGGLSRRIVDYSRQPFSLERAARETLGKRLVAIAQCVETALGGPQDIEGILKGDEIYLVQSRPQTGLEATA